MYFGCQHSKAQTSPTTVCCVFMCTIYVELGMMNKILHHFVLAAFHCVNNLSFYRAFLSHTADGVTHEFHTPSLTQACTYITLIQRVHYLSICTILLQQYFHKRKLNNCFLCNFSKKLATTHMKQNFIVL